MLITNRVCVPSLKLPVIDIAYSHFPGWIAWIWETGWFVCVRVCSVATFICKTPVCYYLYLQVSRGKWHGDHRVDIQYYKIYLKSTFVSPKNSQKCAYCWDLQTSASDKRFYCTKQIVKVGRRGTRCWSHDVYMAKGPWEDTRSIPCLSQKIRLHQGNALQAIGAEQKKKLINLFGNIKFMSPSLYWSIMHSSSL